MPTWGFLQKGEQSDDELVRRYQAQTIADIYRTMQSRLDGYRQAAAAVFLGVAAAVFAIDGAFFRSVVDPNFYAQLSTSTGRTIALTIIAVGLLPTLLALFGAIVVSNLARYFAEMTSIIYKIDVQNEVFADGAWIPNAALYPKKFKAGSGNVSRDKGETLQGWHDPSIRWFRILTWILFLMHSILYSGVAVMFFLWT
jgi:hypothetical protein